VNNNNKKYRESVENFEKVIGTFKTFLGDDEQAILAYNVFYLKLQPQYGEMPQVH